jgi:hypothetical protein
MNAVDFPKVEQYWQIGPENSPILPISVGELPDAALASIDIQR